MPIIDTIQNAGSVQKPAVNPVASAALCLIRTRQNGLTAGFCIGGATIKINSKQLAELRSAWERKSYATFVLHQSQANDELIVLVERERWSLNRYFIAGDGLWRVSMDMRDGLLADCLRTFEQIFVLKEVQA